MQSYKSKSGKSSGVTGYKIEDDSITVEFDHSVYYTYTYGSAGPSTIEAMKSLAQAQKGLSTFISQKKPNYSYVR